MKGNPADNVLDMLRGFTLYDDTHGLDRMSFVRLVGGCSQLPRTHLEAA